MLSKSYSILVTKLCKAIHEKRLIKFFYENTTRNHKDWRTIEPYLIGIRKENGNIFLTGWFLPTKEQLEKGEKAEQKQYLIDRIEKLSVLDKKFSWVRIDADKIYNTPTIEVVCNVNF